jgi:hypothetical protein
VRLHQVADTVRHYLCIGVDGDAEVCLNEGKRITLGASPGSGICWGGQYRRAEAARDPRGIVFGAIINHDDFVYIFAPEGCGLSLLCLRLRYKLV